MALLPSMSNSDASMSSASVNQAGMRVGGDYYGQSSGLPDFLRTRLSGQVTAEPAGMATMHVGLFAAGLLLGWLLIKRGK